MKPKSAAPDADGIPFVRHTPNIPSLLPARRTIFKIKQPTYNIFHPANARGTTSLIMTRSRVRIPPGPFPTVR